MNNRIKNYTIKEIDYIEPEVLFNKIDRGFMPALLTGKGPNDISKLSIIGINPFFNAEITDNLNFWSNIKQLNNSTNFHECDYPVNKLGAIGYISYEVFHAIENIKKRTNDHFTFPLFNWTLYTTYYYFDHNLNKAFLVNITYNNHKILLGKSFEDNGFSVTNLKADFCSESYKKNVNIIKDNIINGEVYEVNLTQGIIGNFSGSPLSLFNNLYKENCSPFSAYLERDNYSIVSNSPEQFLKVENRIVETRPIKGTAPRSENKTLDNILQKELLISEKNQAELFMIVDLMRNDLSKVCKIGSVHVLNPKRVEHYKNVHHLVSIIEGELLDNVDIIDLLYATFPGGSITGCPKVSCMKLTEKVELSSRNLYTGSIFIMNKEYLNSSIVIRSAIIKDNKIQLNSGGAITIDSDAEDEYNESLIKLKSIFKAVNYEDNIQ